MALDLETLGGGGLAGFIASIVTILGWNRRLNRLEDEKIDKEIIDQIEKRTGDFREHINKTLSDLSMDIKQIRSDVSGLMRK